MAWVHQCATSNLLGVLSSGTPLIPIPDAVNIPCSFQNPHTVLNVTCVYMDRLEEIKVQHCLKCPTTVQLLELGLFPCVPVWPGLAVSLVMLEWACTLFCIWHQTCKHGQILWRLCSSAKGTHLGSHIHSVIISIMTE